jgi:hypothetical protein
MANATYVPLKTVNVSVATPSITLDNFSSTYKHLVIAIKAKSSRSTLDYFTMIFNGDTDANYSYVSGQGNGTAVTAGGAGSLNSLGFVGNFPGTNSSTSYGISEVRIYDYASTLYQKNMVAIAGSRNTATNGTVDIIGGAWRKSGNPAITSITIQSGTGSNIVAGSEFTLYGLDGVGLSPAAKATGGVIYSDSTYYYHVFGSTGVFTPTSSLTVDSLTIAGGGGGGKAGGGAGAGSIIHNTSMSLSATGYPITIGAGGNGATSRGSSGSNGNVSTFNGISATGGGGGASNSTNNGSAGGSGGGGVNVGGTGGAANAGTLNGGTGYVNVGGTSNSGIGAGGGGAGQAGQVQTASIGGLGGNGLTTFTSWGSATGVGQFFDGVYYIAGGGAGYSDTVARGGYGGGGASGIDTNNGSNGLTNTGGGAGASRDAGGGNGGNGGSGVVIIRYLKA